MKAVEMTEHANDGRTPYSESELRNILNDGDGWLIRDKQKGTLISYISRFAIVYEEFDNYFNVITTYTVDDPSKFILMDRYEVMKK
jgi:hypothetical protein